MEKSSDMSDAARPTKFTPTMKWDDWAPTFINYLRLLPGTDCVPLNYICREMDEPNPTRNVDFIDDYVMMAPIHYGEAIRRADIKYHVSSPYRQMRILQKVQ